MMTNQWEQFFHGLPLLANLPLVLDIIVASIREALLPSITSVGCRSGTSSWSNSYDYVSGPRRV